MHNLINGLPHLVTDSRRYDIQQVRLVLLIIKLKSAAPIPEQYHVTGYIIVLDLNGVHANDLAILNKLLSLRFFYALVLDWVYN